MEAIIKIEERNGKKAVSARELHYFLESRKDFSSWIKDRIEKYELIENVDFEVFTNFGENLKGGRPMIEYALSMDAAKELSMVEGNEKGKQARRYFIETEKAYKNSMRHDMLDFQLPQTFSEALRLAANQSEQIEQQKLLIERTTVQNKRQTLELVQLAPKVDYFDTVLQSTSTYCTDQIAKELGTTAVSLNKKLAILDVQFRRGEQWVLTAKYVGKGYTKTKTYTHNGTDGFPKTTMMTVWTEAGRLFIHNLIKQQKSA